MGLFSALFNKKNSNKNEYDEETKKKKMAEAEAEYEKEVKFYDVHNEFPQDILNDLKIKDIDESCRTAIKKIDIYDKGDFGKILKDEFNNIIEEKNQSKKKIMKDEIIKKIEKFL